MCTITWQYTETGYRIHFNRDESKLRVKAVSPSIHVLNNIQCLYPVDPQAGGTWISTNEFGVSICLLNNYASQYDSTDGSRLSRGQLVLQLSAVRNIDEARTKINTMPLSLFNAFHCFVFDRQQTLHCCWDGKSSHINIPERQFFSSSGFNTEAVIASRQRLFEQINQLSYETLQGFHRSHQPKQDAYAVCMHRDDAETQSYTEIIVDNNNTLMNYVAGAPCQQTPLSSVTLPLVKAVN